MAVYKALMLIMWRQNLELANPLPEFYPQEGNPPQGWGLSMFLTIAPGATGRGANTGWWAGISNQFWWCDREKGVAGMICGQVLPFGGKDESTSFVGSEANYTSRRECGWSVVWIGEGGLRCVVGAKLCTWMTCPLRACATTVAVLSLPYDKEETAFNIIYIH